jgi:uracil-DNA glycosylase
MRRTWITESYLCSAPVEGRNVRAASWRTCARNYLLPQLELLKDRAIVALGKTKAQPRIEALALDIPFLRMPAAGPPEGNKSSARESWKAICQYLRGSDRTPPPG